MLRLPDCVCIMNLQDSFYQVQNNNYENILDEFSDNLTKNNIPCLFTKESVLDIINNKGKFYNKCINDIEGFRNNMKEVIKQEGEIRNPTSYTSKDGKNNFCFDYVLKINFK